MVGLSRFRRHYPHQVSGGMQQRAAIARAFVTDPGLLLMDEPFAALDAQIRLILQAEPARIWEESRKTVIYITHSIDEALTLGQRVVIMTAQPARIKEVIEVPFEQPRDVVGLSTSARFAEMKLAVWRGPRGGSHAAARGGGSVMAKSARAGAAALHPVLHWAAGTQGARASDRHRGPALHSGAERRCRQLPDLASRRELAAACRGDAVAGAAGFVLGVVPGFLVGLLLSMFRPARYFLGPLIAALFPIPKVALMPLILMRFGFGDASEIAPAAIGVFFPVAVNTYPGPPTWTGATSTWPRTNGASSSRTFHRVFLGALPMIFAGLGIAVSVAFLILVAAELVSSGNGIGFLIWNSWQLLEVDRMFVGIVLNGLIGVAAASLRREFERIAIPWRR